MAAPGARAGRGKPWFVYYAKCCSHAPHHVRGEWSEKYRGRSDWGWDKLREETFERQKKLGVIPSDAVLTERPDTFPAWDSLSDNRKTLYARQIEVYAGYCENADYNVGGCWTLSRRWATSTTRSWSTSGGTTPRAWKARSPARSTR